MAAAGAALAGWAGVADPRWAERHVLPSYCPTNAPEWAIAHGARWAAAGLGAIVVLLAPKVARRIRRASVRTPAVLLVGIALAVAASFAATELMMRSLYARLALGASARSLDSRDRAMTRVDSRLGWAYIPRRTTWTEVAGRRIAYAIDSGGYRAGSSEDASDPGRPTLLFAGESIAFGYGLPYEETFPFLVARDLGIQAVNLGTIGYGNDQAYLRVLGALRQFHRPVAVVSVFIPGQIRRNVDIWRPRLALSPAGALEPVPPSNGPRALKLLQALPYHGDEALRVTAAILRATADAARAHGAFPLFVVTNYGPACVREDHQEPWVVDQLFVQQGLPFVRVDLDREDLLPGVFERHPRLRGTRKIADAVESALSSELARSPK